MTIHNEQEAIQCAIRGGYNLGYKTFEYVLQDSLFWQDLGKARGWEEEGQVVHSRLCKKNDIGCTINCYRQVRIDWKYLALKFFETRLTNGDMTKFWESLP